jgi:hypothetical protein
MSWHDEVHDHDSERPPRPEERLRSAMLLLDAPDVLLVAELAERLTAGRRVQIRAFDRVRSDVDEVPRRMCGAARGAG